MIRVSSVDDSDEDPETGRKQDQDGEDTSQNYQEGFQQDGHWTFPKRMWRNHEGSETLPRGSKRKLSRTKWRRESTSSNSSTVTVLETGEQGKVLEKNSLEVLFIRKCKFLNFTICPHTSSCHGREDIKNLYNRFFNCNNFIYWAFRDLRAHLLFQFLTVTLSVSIFSKYNIKQKQKLFADLICVHKIHFLFKDFSS